MAIRTSIYLVLPTNACCGCYAASSAAISGAGASSPGEAEVPSAGLRLRRLRFFGAGASPSAGGSSVGVASAPFSGVAVVAAVSGP